MTGSQTFRIVHRTDYEYDKPVTMSYGRAHLTPRGDGGQERLDATLAVDPPPAEQRDHVDFSGTYRAISPSRPSTVTSPSSPLLRCPFSDP